MHHLQKLLLVFSILVSGCATYENNQKSSGVVIEQELQYAHIQKGSYPRPTVIIAHGCSGSNIPSYQAWVKQVSKWGYNGVMLDSFLPRGYKNCAEVYPNYVSTKSRAHDIKNLAEWIRKQPWHTGKIAVIGFSHGGGTVLNFASNKDTHGIDVGIAYYPVCSGLGLNFENPRIPVQVHLAKKDTTTPVWHCGAMKNYDMHMYANARHAFDIYKVDGWYYGHYHAYDLEADVAARNRTREYLAKHLK
jgi:dienelactone hydrolase